MPALPLTPVTQVTYTINNVTAPREGFNLGLIIGNSTVISTGTRVVVYNSPQAMLTAGFTTGSPEYLAAVEYFAASSYPTQVAIGVQGVSETLLQAITACRAANTNWYIGYCTGAVDADHTAIAAYMETALPYGMYFAETADSAVLNNTSGNLFQTLHTAAYRRTLGLYTTSTYAGAGLMGYAMGQTSDLYNSAYTLKFKTITGATADNLTSAQVSGIEGNNGNVYVVRGSFYTGFENGTMFSGDWFDNILYTDKLTNEIQLNVADALYTYPKIPQTEQGMAFLKGQVSLACQNLVNIGFLAPGTWTGAPFMSVQTGDTLPAGFLVLSDPIATQSPSNRTARIAPNIYVLAKLAGAIQSVIIEININQ